MKENDFVPSEYPVPLDQGSVRWKAPSNIALVKYWGKRENQMPENASLSFTLSECATVTALSFLKRENPIGDFSFEVWFEGKPKADFAPKIETFFRRAQAYLPFLGHYHFKIHTSNSFPHSSGIASSASGMAALALCLMDMERQMDPGMFPDFFVRKASFLARLGSGSAARSIEGPLVTWGEHKDIAGSSDRYAIPYPYLIHQDFTNFCDTILLIHKGQKQVSSTVGHDLMHGHPFARQRFSQAQENLSRLGPVLAEGNLAAFVKIVEGEALALHAMMMTADPYFILIKPNTLTVIHKIWAFRERSGTDVCFTLDAGANVHVLYPHSQKEIVDQFIQDELVAYCENQQYICDKIGFGAEKLKMDN